MQTPVTHEEAQTLSQWEALVLDYRQTGVLEAVGDDGVPMGPHIIARLDLAHIIPSAAPDTELDLSRAVHLVSSTVEQILRQPGQKRYFTGVLIAEWRDRIPIPLLHGLTKLLSAHGLDTYLEVGAPEFLDGVKKLDLTLFAGVVVRSGTIKSNGERRGFFEMDKMKTTTRSFVSQACQRPFITMMWDTVDDDAELSHAVLRRAHMWCSYHGAIRYFPRQRALTNIHDVSFCEEPLAAFQWLKTRKVMDIDDKYRNTRTVGLLTIHKHLILNTISFRLGLPVSSTITCRCRKSSLSWLIRSLVWTETRLMMTMHRVHLRSP